VDFSRTSRAALRCAAAIAQRFHGRLVVLFVNDPLLVAAASAAADSRGLVATSTKELKQFASRVLKGETSPVLCLVAVGVPPQEILKTASRLSCDVIVMGTSGVGSVGRLFFGSTIDRVLRATRIPVVAVPPTTTAARKKA
jgi:nucleotide-binding universal stress UspA family protein